jgi:hypothetical protein
MDARTHTRNPAHGKVGYILNTFPITRNIPIPKTITAKKVSKLDPGSIERRRTSNL